MTLVVKGSRQGPWTVLHIRGELDLMSSSEVRREVHAAVAAGRRDVVLDLADVVFCDSSGVGVLVASRRLLNSCGGRLRLVLPDRHPAHGAHVRRVLGALGVRRLFEVYGEVGQAVAAAEPGTVPV
ncbi:STAS domain-containing protein [Streptomyces sp. NPDC000594]|uniref:STAS domain-containing protein n=1 Tax=Streptomyces sp. NPDC000594 TaxID=3154261 RepID=UPI0033323472